MSIQTLYTDVDKAQWQQLVSESPTASWFQTPQAYDFYAALPEMMTPFVVAVTRESAETPPLSAASPLTNSPLLKGLILGYITRERNPLKQFFSRRAIIYGGPLLADDITDDELRTLLMSLIKTPLTTPPLSAASPLTNPIYIETRNFSDYSRWRHVFEQCGFCYQPHFDMFINCSDRAAMLARVHDSKLRQIRKAQIEGVKIVEATTEQEVAEFYTLLKALYQKKVRTPLFPVAFFTTFVKQKRGVLLLTKRDGKVIGGMLCPILEGEVLYEWYVVGPAIVTWAAMEYAATHDLPCLDLMGAGEPDVPYGVRDFKLQFGGDLHEFGRFMNVNSIILYCIGKVVISITRRLNLFFFEADTNQPA